MATAAPEPEPFLTPDPDAGPQVAPDAADRPGTDAGPQWVASIRPEPDLARAELETRTAAAAAIPPDPESAFDPEPAFEPEPEPAFAPAHAFEPEPEPVPEPDAEPHAAQRLPFEPDAEPFLEPEEPAYPPAPQPIPPTGAFRPGSSFAAAASTPAEAAPAQGVPAAWPSPGPSAAPRWGDAQAAAAARWANVVTDPEPPATVAPPSAAASRPLVPALPVLVLERGVALATGVIAIAFLLPWGNLMIGAAVAGDPWQTLGIVGSWHWLAWLLALPVILLATSAPAVPAWLRLGVLPIAYAGLVVGIAWPYVLGPIGGAPAPMVLVFAAVALAVLGALAVRPGGIEDSGRPG